MQGKSELGMAVGDCSACLRLRGSAGEYILNSPAGNATLTVDKCKCLGKGPHDLRDTSSYRHGLDQSIMSTAGERMDFSQGLGSTSGLKGSNSFEFAPTLSCPGCSSWSLR